MENLQIGTYGWRHQNWLESFYPDDLPEDWQLDYFSNAYRVLLVPMSDWLSWQSLDLEEVVDSVEAPFYFYLAVEHPLEKQQIEQLETVVNALGESVAGMVAWKAELVEQLKAINLPVTLVSENEHLSGWSWQLGAITFSGNPLVVLSELPTDGKAQVAILKSFMQSLPSEVNGAPLIVGGDSIDMEQVANLKTVGELLGF